MKKIILAVTFFTLIFTIVSCASEDKKITTYRINASSNSVQIGKTISLSLDEYENGGHVRRVYRDQITRYIAIPQLGEFSNNGDYIDFTAGSSTGTTVIVMDYNHGIATVSAEIEVIP